MARCILLFLQLISLWHTVLLCSASNQKMVGKTTEQNLVFADPATQSTFQGTCDPECKYGDCTNGTCVCMKIFQGDDCRQPKPWFLAAVCVAGTIALIVMISLLCCICSSFAGCKKKQTITVNPTH